jgi:hypothetical protein
LQRHNGGDWGELDDKQHASRLMPPRSPGFELLRLRREIYERLGIGVGTACRALQKRSKKPCEITGRKYLISEQWESALSCSQTICLLNGERILFDGTANANRR